MQYMPKAWTSAALKIGLGIGLLVLLFVCTPNRTQPQHLVPEELSYSIRNLIITIPSNGWRQISHEDYAVYLRSWPFEAKLDASYFAKDRVDSRIRRWATRDWVWDFYAATGPQMTKDYRGWDISMRLERDSVVFVAFHPFGVIIYGKVQNEGMLYKWLGQIDLLQRG
jgi:hypothetical protein